MLEKPPTSKVPNLNVVKILMTKSGTRIATIVLPSRGFGLLKGSEAGLNVAKSRNSLAIALVTWKSLIYDIVIVTYKWLLPIYELYWNFSTEPIFFNRVFFYQEVNFCSSNVIFLPWGEFSYQEGNFLTRRGTCVLAIAFSYQEGSCNPWLGWGWWEKSRGDCHQSLMVRVWFWNISIHIWYNV